MKTFKFFIITYDIRIINSYSNFYDEIKNIGEWQHIMESSWIVKTCNHSADSIYKLLKPHILDEDTLFIVDITNKERSGWLHKSMWNWLNKV